MARLADALDPETFGGVLRTGRVSQAFRLVDEARGAPEVLRDLERFGDDALRRFLSLEEGLAQANDIASVGKTPEELAHQTRLAVTRAASSDVDGIAMRTSTIDRLSRSIDEMARGDVDNFANHLDSRIAQNAENLEPSNLESTLRPKNIYSPVKGGAFEIIAGKELWGPNAVDEIGAKSDTLPDDFDADIVLEEGRVVELKSAGVPRTTDDVQSELENIRAVQVAGDTAGKSSQPVLFVVNDPTTIYRSGQLGDELLPKFQEARGRVDFPTEVKAASEVSDETDSIVKWIPSSRRMDSPNRFVSNQTRRPSPRPVYELIHSPTNEDAPMSPMVQLHRRTRLEGFESDFQNRDPPSHDDR